MNIHLPDPQPGIDKITSSFFKEKGETYYASPCNRFIDSNQLHNNP